MPLAQISEKRLAANRANARKSTGPRTAKGKAKVSANARRTGSYSEDHRMPPRLEAHFRALAEARTQILADPTLRALTFEWHMLQGHLVVHESRERALFNAGLEYGCGNEEIARDWVLRQHGYIQALNRYAGWIQMGLGRVESAILATPIGPDHLAQFLRPEPEQPPSPAHVGPHLCCAGLEPRRVGTPETAALLSSKPLAAEDQPGPAKPATTEPTAIFERTNPPVPEPPPAQRVTLEPNPKLEPKPEFEGTNPPVSEPPPTQRVTLEPNPKLEPKPEFEGTDPPVSEPPPTQPVTLEPNPKLESKPEFEGTNPSAVQRPAIPPATLEPTMELEGTNPLSRNRPAPPMASPATKPSSIPHEPRNSRKPPTQPRSEPQTPPH
ncbi:hypothetical protein [Paludibaculum fermentans]|uniref:Uncharacterized protein n=1 Tax=Paludibaculum fermentans TaxID=1473598 RepID=A0A7S7NQS8_PALFE|nr:hypothetical protein [Paludibaculum fermentans]QOY88033.1 hypothetical protein IRI77_35745 [Paludibaculum fermentans]